MINLSLKVKVIITITIIGAFFLFIFRSGLPNKPIAEKTIDPPETIKDITKEKPQIISTRPDPLEDTIISAQEVIEISFNRPLENVGEFKVRIEPKIEYKVELSGDRKTAKILPVKPYQLGTTYTMFIGPESKFDGVGRWGEEKIYHFRTIKYTGV